MNKDLLQENYIKNPKLLERETEFIKMQTEEKRTSKKNMLPHLTLKVKLRGPFRKHDPTWLT